jgi:hypothetical protein
LKSRNTATRDRRPATDDRDYVLRPVTQFSPNEHLLTEAPQVVEDPIALLRDGQQMTFNEEPNSPKYK